MARKSRKNIETNQSSVVAPSKSEKVYNTALYVRRSTLPRGQEDEDSIESQQSMLEHYTSRYPDFRVERVFIDNGETGTDFNRPAWNDLIEECRVGNINCIVTKDLSRIGRSYLDVGQYLEIVFPLLKVRVIAINDNYDNIEITTNDQITSALRNIMNEVYSKDISRKAGSVLHLKQEKGDFIGTYAPYGYKKAPENKNKLLIDPASADIVKIIFFWKAEGDSYVGICRKLMERDIPSPSKYRWVQGISQNSRHKNALWTPQAIKHILQNPVYLGHMMQGKYLKDFSRKLERRPIVRDNWIVVRNTHEPIVDQELFDRVRDGIAARQEKYHPIQLGNEKDWILKGLVYCGDCNHLLFRRRVTGGKEDINFRYQCPTYNTYLDKGCPSKVISEEELEQHIFTCIKEDCKLAEEYKSIVESTMQRPSYIEFIARCNIEINNISMDIKMNRHSQQTAYEDFLDNLLDRSTLLEFKKQYDLKLENSEQLLANLDTEKELYLNMYSPSNPWLSIFMSYSDAETLTKDMVAALVERIDVYEGGLLGITLKYREEFRLLDKFIWGNLS